MKGTLILAGAAALLLAATAQAQSSNGAGGTASGALSPPSTATPPTNPPPASSAATSGSVNDTVGAITDQHASRITGSASGDASAAAAAPNSRQGYDARDNKKKKAKKGSGAAPTEPQGNAPASSIDPGAAGSVSPYGPPR